MFLRKMCFVLSAVVLGITVGCEEKSNQKVATDAEVAAFIEENKQLMSNQETMDDALGNEGYVSPKAMERTKPNP